MCILPQCWERAGAFADTRLRDTDAAVAWPSTRSARGETAAVSVITPPPYGAGKGGRRSRPGSDLEGTYRGSEIQATIVFEPA